MGFPRQEYWSRLPFPFPWYLPNPGIEPSSPILQVDSLPPSHLGSPVRKEGLAQKQECTGPIEQPSLVASNFLLTFPAVLKWCQTTSSPCKRWWPLALPISSGPAYVMTKSESQRRLVPRWKLLKKNSTFKEGHQCSVDAMAGLREEEKYMLNLLICQMKDMLSSERWSTQELNCWGECREVQNTQILSSFHVRVSMCRT